MFPSQIDIKKEGSWMQTHDSFIIEIKLMFVQLYGFIDIEIYHPSSAHV